MTREPGNPIRWFVALTLCIVAGWLCLKSACYHHFQYAYDIFSSLDMSRSWIDGHALLYETRYGDHSRVHNYYFHLLLSPFTATLGAFGLFLAHALLLALSLYVVLRSSRHVGPDRRFHLAIWTLAFFLGPQAFWIWDDPYFGWHVELLFVPMAVLFGASLMQERLWPKLVAGALLVSMREDGCVVACCVHLFWYWAARMDTGAPGFGKVLVRMCGIAAAWLLVFGAGMWLLAYKNGFQGARVDVALSELWQVPWAQRREYLGTMAAEILAMLAPMALFAFVLFKARYAIAMMVLTAPLLAVGSVASLVSIRTGTTWFGLTWNPRFAMVLGFQFHCMVYMILRGEHSRLFRWIPRKAFYSIYCVLLALIQWHALTSVRHFDTHVGHYVRALTSAPGEEAITLKRLAAAIPRETYVSVPAVYLSIFEWHRYVWIDYSALVNAPVQEPDVVIVLETDHLRAVDASLYAKHKCGNLTVWHKPSVQLDLSWSAGPRQTSSSPAVVLWRPAGMTAPAGMTLVDPVSGATDIRGLDPETVGTGAMDGTHCVLVADSGLLVAGLGVDNRAGRAQRPLPLRRIALRGSTVHTDELATILMLVPPGEAWHVSDIKERSDGSLLVAATRTASAANAPASAAFLVDSTGGVEALSLAAFPPGSLVGIADAGDRCVGALMRGGSRTDIEVVSVPVASGPAPFRVHEFRDTAGFGSMDVDVDGTLVLVLAPAGASSAAVVRLPHTRDATPTQVAGPAGPARGWVVNPVSGEVAGFSAEGTPLDVANARAVGPEPASAFGPRTLVDISVKDNPGRYGTASASGPVTPWLGTFGGPPRHGNGSFGARVGGPGGAAGVLLLGVGRAEVPTRFGQLLLDPAGPILVVAPVGLPESGSARVGLPLSADPATAGTTVNLQAVLFSSPLRVDLTPGLELTIR